MNLVYYFIFFLFFVPYIYSILNVQKLENISDYFNYKWRKNVKDKKHTWNIYYSTIPVVILPLTYYIIMYPKSNLFYFIKNASAFFCILFILIIIISFPFFIYYTYSNKLF